MSNSGDQFSLFEDLPEVRKPTNTGMPRRESPKTRKASTLMAETDTVVLEPVEPIAAVAPQKSAVRFTIDIARSAPATSANVMPQPSAVTAIEEAYPKQPGQLEAEELRRRNARADRLEDRSNEYGKAFLKFAILYLAAKAGIPVYHYILAKLALPPMDGTLVSAGIGIACTWHYSQMLTHALLSHEHVYQFEIRFEAMSGWGKFATMLQWLTTVGLFALFAIVFIWTVVDALSVLNSLVEYSKWAQGTTVTPYRPR